MDAFSTRHNDNTITSARRLIQEAKGIRANGYAVDDEEDEVGYRCIGVPVVDEYGTLLAAISVAGSVVQVTSENMNQLVGVLRKASENITDALRQ